VRKHGLARTLLAEKCGDASQRVDALGTGTGRGTAGAVLEAFAVCSPATGGAFAVDFFGRGVLTRCLEGHSASSEGGKFEGDLPRSLSFQSPLCAPRSLTYRRSPSMQLCRFDRGKRHSLEEWLLV